MRLASLPLFITLLLLSCSAFAQEALDVAEVFSAYADNEVSADAKYLNKLLNLSVKVELIGKDSKGRYFLEPIAKKPARCYFTSSQNEMLSKLKRGDNITLHGLCRGFDRDRENNHLLFAECQFGLAPLSSEALAALDNVKRSLVIVKGIKGSGSGFVATLGGVKCIASNFHVFDDNANLKLFDCDNRQLEFTSVKFAPDRDLALFELADQANSLPPIEIKSGIATLPLGTAVRVYGNSAGESVFTEISGKVLGVGPSTIEVDAPFIGGNSGSPVLEFPSMKVLGVATYASMSMASWVSKGTRFSDTVRRFATRIDNIDTSALELYDKQKFDTDLKAFKAIEESTELKAAACANLRGIGLGYKEKNTQGWNEFLRLAGKLPDSGRKARLVSLMQQWNKEVEALAAEMPSASRSDRKSAKSETQRMNGPSNSLGIDSSSGSSLQKLPFDDLNRLLFTLDAKPQFSYKRFQEKAAEAAAMNAELQKLFKEKFDDLKATLRK